MIFPMILVLAPFVLVVLVIDIVDVNRNTSGHTTASLLSG